MKVFTAIFAFVVVFQTATFTAKKTNIEKRRTRRIKKRGEI